MRNFTLAAVCLIGVLLRPVEALPAKFQLIDSKISAMQADPEAAQYGPYWCNEVVINSANHPWPAVGVFKVHYQFYYERDEGQPGIKDPQPYPNRLVKAIAKREFSNRWETIEFWFVDGKPSMGRHKTSKLTTEVDLTGPPSRLQQEYQREAGSILDVFMRIQALP